MPPQDYTRGRTDDDAPVLEFVVEGVKYRLDASQVTSRMELKLAKQSDGMLRGLGQIMKDMEVSPASYLVAGLVYLARLVDGDDITFDEVADSVTVVSGIEVVETEADADPEAPAAD